MFSSYLKYPWCSLKTRQPISVGWQTASLPMPQLPMQHRADTNTYWQHWSVSKNSFLSLASYFMQVCCKACVKSACPPPQPHSATRKEGAGITEPPDKALLTTIYKSPFIHPVPKIASWCNHELNTRLWIPFLHLQETKCPLVTSSPSALILCSAIKCWPFLSHSILDLVLLQTNILKGIWRNYETSPMHLHALYAILWKMYCSCLSPALQ